ncbi:hypothetical protein [Amycolatopsis magusensis]
MNPPIRAAVGVALSHRIQACPPGTRYAPADSATDAIADCRYFLA